MAKEKTVQAMDFSVQSISAANINVLSITSDTIPASADTLIVYPGVAVNASDSALGVSGFIIGVSGTGAAYSFPTLTVPLSFGLSNVGYTTVPVTATRLDNFNACTTVEITGVATFILSGGDMEAGLTKYKTTNLVMSAANVPVGSQPCASEQCRKRLLGYI